MRAFSTALQGWKFVGVVLFGAALSSGWLYVWHAHHFAAAPMWSDDHLTGRESLFAPPRLEARPLPGLFSPAPQVAAERARARLEAMSMPFDGPNYVASVRSRLTPMIDLYHQAGIDRNVRGAGGRTALLTAGLDQNWPLWGDLLQGGANPNLADDGGVTPLMAAALADRVTAVESLLAKGATKETVDSAGRTAAHYAVGAGASAALKKLLDAGAPVSESLLALAWESGDERLIGPVLSLSPAKMEWDQPSRAAFREAVAARDATRTRLLLAHYDGPPAPEGSAQPWLAYTILRNDLPELQFLLECGLDPNTSLSSPVEKSFALLVTREFLRNYLTTEPGMNVLMLSAGLGRSELVKALLEKGARRGTPTDHYKMAALSFASFTEDVPTLQALITDAPTPDQFRIEISLGDQRASVIRNGASILSTEISTGRPGFSTPKGNFVVTDKHLDHVSTIYKAKMPFFMRLNGRDFGMHQGVVPGHPASHGCIRLPGDVARRLFKEVPVGTLVSIRD